MQGPSPSPSPLRSGLGSPGLPPFCRLARENPDALVHLRQVYAQGPFRVFQLRQPS